MLIIDINQSPPGTASSHYKAWYIERRDPNRRVSEEKKRPDFSFQ
jgi:hypothetical protein